MDPKPVSAEARVALVATGGARRIGRQITRSLHAAGVGAWPFAACRAVANADAEALAERELNGVREAR